MCKLKNKSLFSQSAYLNYNNNVDDNILFLQRTFISSKPEFKFGLLWDDKLTSTTKEIFSHEIILTLRKNFTHKTNKTLYFKKRYFLEDLKKKTMYFFSTVNNWEQYYSLAWVTNESKLLSNYLFFKAKKNKQIFIGGARMNSRLWIPGSITNYKSLEKLKRAGRADQRLTDTNLNLSSFDLILLDDYPVGSKHAFAKKTPSNLFSWTLKTATKEVFLTPNMKMSFASIWENENIASAKTKNEQFKHVLPLVQRNQTLKKWFFFYIDQCLNKRKKILKKKAVNLSLFLSFQNNKNLKKNLIKITKTNRLAFLENKKKKTVLGTIRKAENFYKKVAAKLINKKFKIDLSNKLLSIFTKRYLLTKKKTFIKFVKMSIWNNVKKKIFINLQTTANKSLKKKKNKLFDNKTVFKKKLTFEKPSPRVIKKKIQLKIKTNKYSKKRLISTKIEIKNSVPSNKLVFLPTYSSLITPIKKKVEFKNNVKNKILVSLKNDLVKTVNLKKKVVYKLPQDRYFMLKYIQTPFYEYVKLKFKKNWPARSINKNFNSFLFTKKKKILNNLKNNFFFGSKKAEVDLRFFTARPIIKKNIICEESVIIDNFKHAKIMNFEPPQNVISADNLNNLHNLMAMEKKLVFYPRISLFNFQKNCFWSFITTSIQNQLLAKKKLRVIKIIFKKHFWLKMFNGLYKKKMKPVLSCPIKNKLLNTARVKNPNRYHLPSYLEKKQKKMFGLEAKHRQVYAQQWKKKFNKNNLIKIYKKIDGGFRANQFVLRLEIKKRIFHFFKSKTFKNIHRKINRYQKNKNLKKKIKQNDFGIHKLSDKHKFLIVNNSYVFFIKQYFQFLFNFVHKLTKKDFTFKNTSKIKILKNIFITFSKNNQFKSFLLLKKKMLLNEKNYTTRLFFHWVFLKTVFSKKLLLSRVTEKIKNKWKRKKIEFKQRWLSLRKKKKKFFLVKNSNNSFEPEPETTTIFSCLSKKNMKLVKIDNIVKKNKKIFFNLYKNHLIEKNTFKTKNHVTNSLTKIFDSNGLETYLKKYQILFRLNFIKNRSNKMSYFKTETVSPTLLKDYRFLKLCKNTCKKSLIYKIKFLQAEKKKLEKKYHWPDVGIRKQKLLYERLFWSYSYFEQQLKKKNKEQKKQIKEFMHSVFSLKRKICFSLKLKKKINVNILKNRLRIANSLLIKIKKNKTGNSLFFKSMVNNEKKFKLRFFSVSLLRHFNKSTLNFKKLLFKKIKKKTNFEKDFINLIYNVLPVNNNKFKIIDETNKQYITSEIEKIKKNKELADELKNKKAEYLKNWYQDLKLENTFKAARLLVLKKLFLKKINKKKIKINIDQEFEFDPANYESIVKKKNKKVKNLKSIKVIDSYFFRKKNPNWRTQKKKLKKNIQKKIKKKLKKIKPFKVVALQEPWRTMLLVNRPLFATVKWRNVLATDSLMFSNFLNFKKISAQDYVFKKQENWIIYKKNFIKRKSTRVHNEAHVNFRKTTYKTMWRLFKKQRPVPTSPRKKLSVDRTRKKWRRILCSESLLKKNHKKIRIYHTKWKFRFLWFFFNVSKKKTLFFRFFQKKILFFEKKKTTKKISKVFLLTLLAKNQKIKSKSTNEIIKQSIGSLKVVLTLNNIFVFAAVEQKKKKKKLLLMSTGQLGFEHTKKNLFTTAWLLGRTVAELLNKNKTWSEQKIKKITICNGTFKSLRLRFILKGFKENRLLFNFYTIRNKVSFNGCRKEHFPRTGRKRKIFFS